MVQECDLWQSSICNLMCSITKSYEIIGNIINHFGHVTSITNTVVVNVPFDIINILRGHHNLKALNHCKCTKLLKTYTTQKVLQSLDDENSNKL